MNSSVGWLAPDQAHLSKEVQCLVHLVEMDRNVRLAKQLEDRGGSVILVNRFDVPVEDIDQFLACWEEDGSISSDNLATSRRGGIGGSGVFLNVAVWETVDHYRRALASFRGGAPANVVASPSAVARAPACPRH